MKYPTQIDYIHFKYNEFRQKTSDEPERIILGQRNYQGLIYVRVLPKKMRYRRKFYQIKKSRKDFHDSAFLMRTKIYGRLVNQYNTSFTPSSDLCNSDISYHFLLTK